MGTLVCLNRVNEADQFVSRGQRHIEPGNWVERCD